MTVKPQSPWPADDPLEEAFSTQGALASNLPDFVARPAQLDMARSVAETLITKGALVTEAGTGTGKTFAYLVPALYSGRKVVLSTATRNLQDQLFHRDLPLLRKALGIPARVAILKGRANYLCKLRLEQTLEQDHAPQHWKWLHQVRPWAGRTQSGDLAELNLPQDLGILPWITSSSDNCLGQNCGHWRECHLVEARRRAQEADLVIVNHYLLGADWALKNDGFGELLPEADAYILDEAHQFPEIVGQFFGSHLSSRQFQEWLTDCRNAYVLEAGDVLAMPQALDMIEHRTRELRLALEWVPERGDLATLIGNSQIMEALTQLHQACNDALPLLEAQRSRGKQLDNSFERCHHLTQALLGWLQTDDADASQSVRWYETYGRGFRLHATPIDISPLLATRFHQGQSAWIFTSATLSVAGSFAHFAERIGLQDYASQRWDSPFDYAHQTLLYLPKSMPDPRDRHFDDAVIALCVKLISIVRGRTFVLFTSHRALRLAAEQLGVLLDFPILAQGQAPQSELLERFRSLGNAVLLGAASFWEGVDVRGEALSCVIIDRLPFASPSDPVMQARIQAFRERGLNAFNSLQLPQAVIALKQGAGRLIRGESDRGVLAICDPRLRGQRYGRVFLDSLPPMPQTQDLQQVEYFFHASAHQDTTL